LEWKAIAKPSAASLWAIANPIPEVEPVIRATLFLLMFEVMLVSPAGFLAIIVLNTIAVQHFNLDPIRAYFSG
jgi:hypothetical protein